MRHEFRSQLVEQHSIRWRVRIPKIVDGIDDALADHVVPQSVDDRSGEVRISRAGEPLDKFFAAVVVRAEFAWRCAERDRRDVLIRDRVPDFRSAVEIHDLVIAHELLAFEFHPREVGGKSVVVSLSDRFERVVVALRAADADPEKQLRHRLGRVFRRAGNPMKIRRWPVQRVAETGECLPGKLVERPIVLKAVDQVAMKTVDATFADRDIAAAHDVRPFHRPENGKFITVQKLVDQRAAFLWLLRIEKRGGFLGGGQCADGVEVNSPQEDFIGSELRGKNLQFTLVSKHRLVDEILDRRRAIHKLLIRLHAGEASSDNLPEISHEEGGFGRAGKLDESGSGDGRAGIFLRRKDGQVCHVT